jgi:hypothetical protein
MNGQGIANKNPPQDFATDGTRLLDELIRRKLKVGNPSSVDEMLRALQARYPQKDAAITAEGMGLPPTAALALVPAANTTMAQQPKSFATVEYDSVLSQLQTDFNTVINSADNRDYNVELAGWQTAALREYGDGAAAARLAQDPGQRERAFLAVRRLNEYAFAVRAYGTTTGESFWDFRRLGTSLDNAADNLRILIGETLYDVGLAMNGYLLQVPLSDFRARGQGLGDALDGWLTGDQEIFDDWGERLTSYQQFFDQLDPDLRVYARPDGLRGAVDTLVNAVANGMSSSSAEALRQLAITVPPEVERLRRVFQIAGNVLNTGAASSSLSIFTRSLGLFIEAFDDPRGGILYIDLALPSPLSGRKLPPSAMPERILLRQAVDARSIMALLIESTLAYAPRTDAEVQLIVQQDMGLLTMHLVVDELANANV